MDQMSIPPEELERLAFQRKEMPDTRYLSEMMLFLAFRNLYDFAARVQMSPEQGRREKSELLEKFRACHFLEQIYEDTADMWKNIELAAIAYRKEPSVQTADKLLEAIYGVKRKIDKGSDTP